MEMGIGFESIWMAQEETITVGHYTLCEMVEGETGDTMQMQTQMQVRRKEREEDSVGAAREEQMARTAQHGKVNPDRSSSETFHERKKRDDSKRDQNP